MSFTEYSFSVLQLAGPRASFHHPAFQLPVSASPTPSDIPSRPGPAPLAFYDRSSRRSSRRSQGSTTACPDAWYLSMSPPLPPHVPFPPVTGSPTTLNDPCFMTTHHVPSTLPSLIIPLPVPTLNNHPPCCPSSYPPYRPSQHSPIIYPATAPNAQ